MAQGNQRQRVQFVERGLACVDATLDAVEKTIPLVQAGWQFFPGPSVARPRPAALASNPDCYRPNSPAQVASRPL